MRTLTYNEMLSLPEAKNFSKRDNPKLLADYLVRRLCNKTLADFGRSEAFKIEAQIATLVIDENGARLESKYKSTDNLVELFSKINSTQDRIRRLLHKAKIARNPKSMNAVRNLANSTTQVAKNEFKLADEALFKTRQTTCEACGNCNLSKARLRLNSSKCPQAKW